MRFFIISRKMLMIIAIVLVFIIIGGLIFVFTRNSKEVFKEDIYYKGTRDEKVIAFVCNVDWGNEYIPLMLEIFQKNDIRISFFLTGRWAEKNPELVKTIMSFNHEIGNHGYNHKDYSKLSYEENKQEIKKTADIIADITGKTPKYFGPPSGAFNENTIRAAKDLDNKMILWSIDTIDWREDSTKEIIVKRVNSKAEESAIVLMHPTKNTVESLPEIINYLFQNGYKIGTIGDVIS